MSVCNCLIGCAGLTNTEACLTAIEMSRVDASFFTFAVVHSALSMKTIDAAGSPAQKQYWLPLVGIHIHILLIIYIYIYICMYIKEIEDINILNRLQRL